MAAKFTLNILGTASAKPNPRRASSAQLLQAAGRLFLIDCGEGVQSAFHRQNEKLKAWALENHQQGLRRLSKTQLDCIMISHIHGDHLFGLFPLLDTMALNGRTKALKIFGPNNLGPVLTFYRSYWGEKNPFELEFTPLKMKEPQTVLELPGLRVEAFPLKHGIDCYGYLFSETGPCLDHGNQFKPRSFAYCSDTAYFPELSSWVRDVDLLYHEATYKNADCLKAHKRFHSTTADAARTASDSGAARLVVSHYSSAIAEDDIHASYEEELRSFFPEAIAADDGDIFDIPPVFL